MSNTINPYSIYNGISGLASGLDTESIVEKLLANETAKVEKIKADKQIATWQQEAYHEIMDSIKAFSSKYFDVLSKDTYLFSKGNTKSVTLSNLSDNASNFLEITAGSTAVTGEHTINEISQLAKSTTTVSTAKVANGLNGTKIINFPLTVAENTSFGIALDGAYCEVPIAAGTFNSIDDLVTGLNNFFDTVYGTDRIEASSVDGKMVFNAPNSVIQVFDGVKTNNFLDTLGMSNAQKNIVNLDSAMSDSLGIVSHNVEFKINGVQFEFTRDMSVRDVMEEINSSDANVTLSYSSLDDTFTMKTKDTGQVSAIVIENQSGEFFGSNSKINITESVYQNGQDAIFYLNDDTKSNPIIRSDNNFTIDGVKYSLKEVTSVPINFEIEQDTEGMVDTIKGFVEEYNALIASIESRLNEKVYSDYKPLTEAQKNEMTEKQIELWEGKAKSGILKYDTNLSKIVSDLKAAFWDDVEGVSSTLYEIGITSTTDYNNFQLTIDETKLEDAIEKNPDAVWDLFIKEGDIKFSRKLTSEEYSERHKEIGFARRVSDILENNISTIRDDYDLKGILVERAGVEGDATQENNYFSDLIDKLNDNIEDAIDRMNDKESYYWSKFTAMERAIQQMNSQSNWLYSQFSS